MRQLLKIVRDELSDPVIVLMLALAVGCAIIALVLS